MVEGKTGPTGNFPDGRLNEEDQGELVVGVRIEQGKVVIDFGTNLNWLALAPDQAKDFAEHILATANKALQP